jgi:hypothetical protein
MYHRTGTRDIPPAIKHAFSLPSRLMAPTSRARKMRHFCNFKVSRKFDNGTSAPFGYHQRPILFVVLILRNVLARLVLTYGTDNGASAWRSNSSSRVKERTTLSGAGDAGKDTNRNGSLLNSANSACSESNSATRASQTWGQRTHCERL